MQTENLREVKNLLMPATMIPSWNTKLSLTEGTDKKVLLQTWGGLGDQICAEPVLRWALKNFKGREFSLASLFPQAFSHLPFKEVFDLNKVKPIYENYCNFQSIYPASHLIFDFICHAMTHCVDHVSISMFRLQLPNDEKHIVLQSEMPKADWVNKLERPHVVVHAGKHWPSKTFPKKFWDRVIAKLLVEGYTPILVGKTGVSGNSGNVGVVDVNRKHCVDLIDKTNLNDLIWLLQNARCVLSNDSSPIHIAASGSAHIGMIASCKHPDYITHFRKTDKGTVEFGWRTENLSNDGLWNYVDLFPVREDKIECDVLPDGVMERLLPSNEKIMEFVTKSWRA